MLLDGFVIGGLRFVLVPNELDGDAVTLVSGLMIQSALPTLQELLSLIKGGHHFV